MRAAAVVRWIGHRFLVLVGLAGSKLLAAAEEIGLPGAGEAFADRRYLASGEPLELATSYIPWALAKGTAIANGAVPFPEAAAPITEAFFR